MAAEEEIRPDDPELLEFQRMQEVIGPIVHSDPPAEFDEPMVAAVRRLGNASIENGE